MSHKFEKEIVYYFTTSEESKLFHTSAKMQQIFI